MVHLKIYGRRDIWGERRIELSDVLHGAVMATWGIPEEKKFHRFILVESGDMVVSNRSDSYLIVEIVCFSGRSRDAKRALIRAFFDDVAPALGMETDDLEVVMVETPAENWGIRGSAGDELVLNYQVDV